MKGYVKMNDTNNTKEDYTIVGEINQSTGEIINTYDKKTRTSVIAKTKDVITSEGQVIQLTEMYKKVYGNEPHFWKVRMRDFMNTLGMISNSKQMDIVLHVLKNANSENLFIGTIKQVEEAVGVSHKTAIAAFKKMQESNIITRKQIGIYMVQPELAYKGQSYKRKELIVKYQLIKEEGKENESKTEED